MTLEGIYLSFIFSIDLNLSSKTKKTIVGYAKEEIWLLVIEHFFPSKPIHRYSPQADIQPGTIAELLKIQPKKLQIHKLEFKY